MNPKDNQHIDDESMSEMFKRLLFPKRDKLLHWLAGVYIALIAEAFKLDIAIILTLVMGIGIGKEIVWDKLLKKGTPEALDAIYVIIGGMSVILFFGIATGSIVLFK